MTRAIKAIARLIVACQKAYTRKWTFLIVSACVFLGSFLTLHHYDLLPDAPAVTPQVAASDSGTQHDTVSTPEEPVKIDIATIGLSATIANPTTTSIGTLDAELLKGAVRYPTSAKLGEVGNMILFGHSSYLPIVHNIAYKTFDGIQKLKEGDVITVTSSDHVYTYKVREVAKENANDPNYAIPLAVSARVLTLATCNSFGTKSDRFVVTADFVESHTVPA